MNIKPNMQWWTELRTFFVLPVIMLNVACQGMSPDLNSSESESGQSYALLGSFGEVDQESGATRSTTRVEDGVGLVGKNLLMDPILRPFSTVSALFNLAGKSVGGIAERT